MAYVLNSFSTPNADGSPKPKFEVEIEEPTFAPINAMSLEALVSEASTAIQRALGQAQNLTLAILSWGPSVVESGHLRYLNKYSDRAWELMGLESVVHELRASSVDACSHDEALRLVLQSAGPISFAVSTGNKENLEQLRFPDIQKLGDQLRGEVARAVERIRARSLVSENRTDGFQFITAATLSTEETTPSGNQGGETSSENAVDGPFGIGGFRWGKLERTGLASTPFRLLTVLWNAKDRTAKFDDVVESVWDDKRRDGHSLRNDSRIGSARRAVNEFMEVGGFPFRVKTSPKNEVVSLIETTKQPVSSRI